MLDQRRRSAWHGLETEAGRRCAAVRRAPARRRMLDEEGRRRPRRPSCAHGVSGRGVRVRTCALVARLELFTQTTTTVCSRPVSPLCVCSVTFSCLLLFGVLSSTSKREHPSFGLLVVLSSSCSTSIPMCRLALYQSVSECALLLCSIPDRKDHTTVRAALLEPSS